MTIGVIPVHHVTASSRVAGGGGAEVEGPEVEGPEVCWVRRARRMEGARRGIAIVMGNNKEDER